MTRPGRFRVGSVDVYLVVAVLILLGLGQVMLFSASSITAEDAHGYPYFYLQRQAGWALLGLVVLLVCSRIHYRVWYRLAGPIFIATVVLLALVLVPGLGEVGGGSQRWLGLGGLRLQPSELAKLALVILYARYLGRGFNQGRIGLGLMGGLLAATGLACLFVMQQPDMGTAVALALTSGILLFAGGAPLVPLGAVVALSAPVAWYLVSMQEYRLRRVMAFLDPWADPLGSGFHIIQSLYGMGSGFLFGLGLGRSRQKYYYIPEIHTDFIFAILGEELGFIGGALVLSLFLFVAWRGFRIARLAPDAFAALLATGITAMITLQVVINVGVVTAIMPITGITLPLFSYGGSSMVLTLAGIGILLNISRHVRT